MCLWHLIPFRQKDEVVIMIEQRDLAEFKSAILTGVIVGIGSLVLIFDNSVSVLIQCPFACGDEGALKYGHGEHLHSAVVIFELLNRRVKEAGLEKGEKLVITFDDRKLLEIIPEENGLESYVLTTRHGICPVSIS